MRKLLLSSIIVLTTFVFIGRLAYLQLGADAARQQLDDTAIKTIFTYPERGYIYDRNGKLLVANQPSYDIMVIPNEIEEFDKHEFCKLLNIDIEEFDKKLNIILKKNSPWLPKLFLSQLSKEKYAFLQEKMRKFKGFYIQKRSLRDYHTKHAANVLGYISQVTEWETQNKNDYNSGELIGRQGIEKQYEKELRGIKGVKHIQKDRLNRDIGSYKSGKFDTLPESGKELTLSIDIDLQAYGEYLMKNKKGGIVAIQPKTGELLSLVSTPTYAPSLLVGRDRGKNYTKMYNDSIGKPLFDRGLQATYPPGSPFKVVNALIALQEGVIDENYRVTCYHGYYYGTRGKKMGCHCPSGARRNLNIGIYESCNAYFADIYQKIINKPGDVRLGMDNWANHVKSFGMGNYLGYDLPIGQRGFVPISKYYDRRYPRWYASNSLSNAIGQGEILTTPIQLANLAAIMANRGYFYTPHILKKIDNEPLQNEYYTVPKYTSIDRKHFEPVIQGMEDVFNRPTGTARTLKVNGIRIAGKTGTAQNKIKIDGKATELTDHSIFIAFAPVEDPKIAIAVYVENGYWGSRWAGKIASLMIEKHIRGEISRTDLETYVLNDDYFIREYAKPYSGKPFRINE
ncbi:MAG: penicillin-binding protein 2 [Flavobacteriaceae bacterium]|nr:penicillin-binding protein 2 [Flavobacteriaceae bacterium]